MKKYKIVACGGTFDYFHKGHEKFLFFVFSVGEKVLIGLASDNFAKSKIEKIESFSERKETLERFLLKEKLLDTAEIVKINDVFGPTLSPNIRIDALVVSKQTLKGAKTINYRRKKLGMKPLNIEISPETKAEDGKIISSSRIRNGEINREGKLFVNPVWPKQNLFLTEKLREELKKPFGKLIKNFDDWLKLNKSALNADMITVGDVVTCSFNFLHGNQKISAVDFFVQRKKCFENLLELGFTGEEEIVKGINPAGGLTPSVFKAVKKSLNLAKINKKVVVQIEGEEDLTALVFVLFSPLGYLIFYGQPNEGVVRIEVTSKVKEKAYKIVSLFNAS